MAIYTEDNNQHSDGSNSIAYPAYYFSVHVFFSRTEGYSIPVKITAESEPTEDEVIKFCVDNKRFSEEGDEECVDTVDEIDVKEYKLMVQS